MDKIKLFDCMKVTEIQDGIITVIHTKTMRLYRYLKNKIDELFYIGTYNPEQGTVRHG